MKTSHSQFIQLVDFMERNGDLSKPCSGPRGRHWCGKKWQELACLLNSDGTGDSRNEEKWRKAAKVRRSTMGTGGGPALKAVLTDLEERVLLIIGEQAAYGIPTIQEAGFLVQEPIDVPVADTIASSPLTATIEAIGDEHWNFPSGSQVPASLLHVETGENEPMNDVTRDKTRSQPRRKQRSQDLDIRNQFLANERERDRRYYEIEKERIRQRDIELKLQAQWLEFMKEALSVIASLVAGNKRNE